MKIKTEQHLSETDVLDVDGFLKEQAPIWPEEPISI
jgi:hypothetical protein